MNATHQPVLQHIVKRGIKLTVLRHELQYHVTILLCLGVKSKLLYSSRWLRVAVSLHELHQLLKTVIRRLPWGCQIADNLVSRCFVYAQQDCMLLLCCLNAVYLKVLLQTFRVRHPLLALVFKGAHPTVHCHRGIFTFGTKYVVTHRNTVQLEQQSV